MPSPNVGAGNNVLTGVAAHAANDVWAVGYDDDQSGSIPVRKTVWMHWDGTGWSVVREPERRQRRQHAARRARARRHQRRVGVGRLRRRHAGAALHALSVSADVTGAARSSPRRPARRAGEPRVCFELEARSRSASTARRVPLRGPPRDKPLDESTKRRPDASEEAQPRPLSRARAWLASQFGRGLLRVPWHEELPLPNRSINRPSRTGPRATVPKASQSSSNSSSPPAGAAAFRAKR